MERLEKLVDAIIRVIDIKENERIWLSAEAETKELVLLINKKLLQIGALVDMDIHFHEAGFDYLYHSPLENLKVFSPVEKAKIDNCDKTVTLFSEGDYVFDFEKILPEKLKIRRETNAMHNSRMDTVPGVGTYFPTPKLAEKAKMKWEEYLDFFFNAVSVDLKALYNEYRWLENLISTGKSIRLKSSDTDLIMDITNRPCLADVSYYWNLPDGELFTSPVENGTNGYISFPYSLYFKDVMEIKDLYVEFKNGLVTNFKASKGEKFFKELLETDEGASRLGEIGIGINPEVDRITNNCLFDEKIIGTAHIALGNSFVEANGENESAIHWDLVKDLRKDGKIYVDDRLVFDSGKWIK
jgi:aminopeptidase